MNWLSRSYRNTRRFFCTRLENPSLFLKPANVFHNPFDIVRRDLLNFRHIAELPMMRSDAVSGGILEGRVAVMIGLINLVDERRPLFGPDTTNSVTRGTIGHEPLLPTLEFSRYGPRCAW